MYKRQEYARRLLFNAAYQKRAEEIIKLVESGITSILERKSHQIEAYKRSVVYHMKELGVSIAIVFLIALMWIWYGMRKVSQPLRETTLFAHRVAEGEAESSIAVSGQDVYKRQDGECCARASADHFILLVRYADWESLLVRIEEIGMELDEWRRMQDVYKRQTSASSCGSSPA